MMKDLYIHHGMFITIFFSILQRKRKLTWNLFRVVGIITYVLKKPTIIENTLSHKKNLVVNFQFIKFPSW